MTELAARNPQPQNSKNATNYRLDVNRLPLIEHTSRPSIHKAKAPEMWEEPSSLKYKCMGFLKFPLLGGHSLLGNPLSLPIPRPMHNTVNVILIQEFEVPYPKNYLIAHASMMEKEYSH
jgi:hypothetical protein